MQCSKCGTSSDMVSAGGNCAVCGFAETGNLASGIGGGAPWETEQAVTTPLSALLHTFRNSFVSTTRCFSQIANNTKLLPALVYGMVFGSIGAFAGVLWNFFPALSTDALLAAAGLSDNVAESFSAAQLIATPIILPVWFFFASVYIHLALTITGSRRKPFLFTFKTVCYASGSMVFELIPFFGSLFSLLAGTWLIVSGIKAVHSISLRRTIFALIGPFLVLMIIAAVIGAIAIAAAGYLSGGQIDPFSFLKR